MNAGAGAPGADGLLASLRAFFAAEPGVLEWGVAPAAPPPNADRLAAWVAGGLHAGLGYMAANLDKRRDPSVLQPWARSVVMFSLAYPVALHPGKPGRYRVAAYAQGDDYHGPARAILARLEGNLRAVSSPRFFGFVDTAPVFERDLAAEAGLGWRGKNCCTLHRNHGSSFFLAGCLLDIALPPSRPAPDFCGGCTLCLDACPTGALEGPGRLDANRCIAYWTIEHKGPLPDAPARGSGAWVFGCDECQTVCPWNRKRLGPGPAPDFDLDGETWLLLLRKGGGFRARFRGTPLARAGRKAMLRNLASAARNLGDTSLAAGLREAAGGEEGEFREFLLAAAAELGASPA